ncbi:MAG: sigma-70 family RNA polymerase sigma factor [Candidatus Omnitrophica bacterium]|jgi:RNA polymerase sigma factor (sigma-70 family)|nr:sigma-70 family RNA polymerase sigma factor [Candidatus Omnitrophota bacterium]
MKNSQEYGSLKKSVNTYVKKYPSSNKNQNNIWLNQLNDLKPYILTDKDKSEEYYNIRNNIALSNGGFAMKYVSRYISLLNDTTSVNELFQEATIGLLESIDTFDLSKNTSFTTYAYFHVRKRLIDFIKYNKLIRAPRDIARNMKSVSEIHNYLLVSLGREPTLNEIQKELKISKDFKLSEKLIESVLLLLELSSATTEDAFVCEYIDQITTDEETELFKNMEIHLMSCIENYSDILKNAIKLRYGIGTEVPHNPEEIKIMLNVSDVEIEKLNDLS